jgi:hypothetical protein
MQLGGPTVDIKGGRFDGKVSRIAEANQRLPSPFSNFAQLQSSFAAVALSTTDMVTLSGTSNSQSSYQYFSTYILFNMGSWFRLYGIM